jgi:hypothetical protein
MKDIKKIVSETLSKKHSINESFERIFLNENDEDKFGLTIQYLGKLIDEGYDNEQIEGVVNEQFDWLKKLFTPNKQNPQDASTRSGILDKVGGGAISQFKEYAITTLLNLIGFKGPLVNAMAASMVEMSLADIIAVFRDKQSCSYHGSTVADAVSEGLVTYIISSSTEEDSMAANFLRNTVFEYIKSSQFGEMLADAICNVAYKAKPAIISNITK